MNKYPKLPKTEKALQDLWVSSNRMLGSHRSSNVELANAGRPIGEVLYDPVKHRRLKPNPFSVQEELTDEEHVLLRKPNRPSDIDVVVHIDPEDKEGLDWVTQAKDDTVLILSGALNNLFTGLRDRMSIYLVGDVARIKDKYLYNGADYVFYETDDNSEASDFIVDTCKNDRLTYVISSYNRLSFEDQSHFSSSVGIKVNHILERRLPTSKAKFATGDPDNPVIDASDKKQLKGWNEDLEMRHQALVDRLGSCGLVVAQVVFEGKNIDPLYGFNVPNADREIALATQRVNPNAEMNPNIK